MSRIPGLYNEPKEQETPKSKFAEGDRVFIKWAKRYGTVIAVHDEKSYAVKTTSPEGDFRIYNCPESDLRGDNEKR